MQVLMASIIAITDGTAMIIAVRTFFLSFPEKTKSVSSNIFKQKKKKKIMSIVDSLNSVITQIGNK